MVRSMGEHKEKVLQMVGPLGEERNNCRVPVLDAVSKALITTALLCFRNEVYFFQFFFSKY